MSVCQDQQLTNLCHLDGTYKWIGHYMDHWSKYHMLSSLCQKSGSFIPYTLCMIPDENKKT